MGTFGLNVYLTQFMFGIVEIPANLGALVLLQRFGRRICQASFLFFGGAACLVILAIPKGTLKPFYGAIIISAFSDRCSVSFLILSCPGSNNSCSCAGEIHSDGLFRHSLHLHCRIIPDGFKVVISLHSFKIFK